MCSSARGNGPRSAANARDAPANEGLAPPVGCVARAPADFQSPRDGLRPAHPVDSWALPSITRHRSLTGGITQQPTRSTLSSYSQANLPKGDIGSGKAQSERQCPSGNQRVPPPAECVSVGPVAAWLRNAKTPCRARQAVLLGRPVNTPVSACHRLAPKSDGSLRPEP